jgi:putative transcriptional regulator
MPETDDHRIEVHLEEILADRGMTLVELSAKVGVTVANLSNLKNGHARALRFTTLTAICDALDCTPGDLLGLQELSRPPERASRSTRHRLGTVSPPPSAASRIRD